MFLSVIRRTAWLWTAVLFLDGCNPDVQNAVTTGIQSVAVSLVQLGGTLATTAVTTLAPLLLQLLGQVFGSGGGGGTVVT
jgi:hypothetical protein